MDLLELSDTDIKKNYENLPGKLEKSLADCREKEFELSRGENSWSIRQIVHHIIDSDFVVQTLILAALGNSGCKYDQTWYPVDNSWAKNLAYNRRPLQTARDLFRISHKHISELLEQLPDALDRTVHVKIEKKPDWQEVSVRDLLLSRLHHTAHHLQQIEATKQCHKI